MNKIFPAIMIALVVGACEGPGGEQTPASAEAQAESSIFDAAVANPARPESDRSRDANRRPADVMAFLGIAPGQKVLEMFAGGGYYTELLAHVVGEDGAVVAHMNEAYLGFVGDEFEARHADNRLPNVDILMAENNELALEPEQFDVVTMILNYHDLYWVAPDRGWARFDVPKLLAELSKGLKPGGTLAIVDHHAEAGSPRETGGTLHRIDPDKVIADVEAAGFILDDESDLLRNAQDDHSKNVFDPAVRGKTDRFVLRFRKPE